MFGENDHGQFEIFYKKENIRETITSYQVAKITVWFPSWF